MRVKNYEHEYNDALPINVHERNHWIDRTLLEQEMIPAMNIASGDTLIVRLDYGRGIGAVYDCLIRRVIGFKDGPGRDQSSSQAETNIKKLNAVFKELFP